MKRILVSLVLVVAAVAGMTMPMMGAEVYASDDLCEDVSDELKAVAGCNDFEKGDKRTAVPIALNIINVVLSFVGLIAVGVIVYGGILYVASTGDASKIHKAKNCILYGVVGLVVAIMAFAIVAFINTSILKK